MRRVRGIVEDNSTSPRSICSRSSAVSTSVSSSIQLISAGTARPPFSPSATAGIQLNICIVGDGADGRGLIGLLGILGCREGSAAKSFEDEDSFPFPCEWIGCSGNDSPSVLDYDSPEDAPPFPEAGSFEPYVQGRMCARPPPARSRELGSSGLASGSGPAGRPAAHMWLQLDLEARARRASRVRTTRIRFGLRLFAHRVY